MGTKESSAPTSGTYGQILRISNPTKTGYKFTGWTVSGATMSGTTLTIGTSNITLTANWKVQYLYYAGNQMTDVTGGWKSRGWKAQEVIAYNPYGPKTTYNSTYMSIYMYWHDLGGAVYVSGVAKIAKDVDLTNVSKLTLDYSVSGESMIGAFFVGNRSATYARSGASKWVEIFGSASSVTKSRTTATLDVSSLSEKYDVVVILYSN